MGSNRETGIIDELTAIGINPAIGSLGSPEELQKTLSRSGTMNQTSGRSEDARCISSATRLFFSRRRPVALVGYSVPKN